MSRFKVALVAYDADSVPDSVPQALAPAGIDYVVNQSTDCQQVLDLAHDADAVWVMGGSPLITPQVLEQLPRCGAIVRTGSGVDNIPIEAATRLGIFVANTPELHARAVAEHTLGLLLAVLRQIPRQDRNIRRGVWDVLAAYPDWHIAGQILGLVGFGRIGQFVARMAAGFELTVIAHDPAIDDQAIAAKGVEPVTLDALLTRSDIVSLHCPLTDATHHLIGEHQLKMMKPTAIIINTARGQSVDQKALTRALTEGWIASAGLDVLETEPIAPDDPLLDLPHIVITPHSAGYFDQALAGQWSHSVRTIIEMTKTGRPLWVANPEVLPRWQKAPTGG